MLVQGLVFIIWPVALTNANESFKLHIRVLQTRVKMFSQKHIKLDNHSRENQQVAISMIPSSSRRLDWPGPSSAGQTCGDTWAGRGGCRAA